MKAAAWIPIVGLLISCPRTAAAQIVTPHAELQEATLSARYRLSNTSAGARTANQLEDKMAFRARVKADRQGRLSLDVGAFSGASLTGSWNNTGLGMGAHTLGVRIKQIYVAAAPVPGVEAQAGSLYVARGENTEITSFDTDAYLTGERVIVRRPRWLFVDALSLTNAYLGDASTPNAFRRLDHLSRVNYGQALAQKAFGRRVALSADWTNAPGGATWRGAARVRLPDDHTSLRLEAYRRPRDDRGGTAVSLDRDVVRGVVASVGYANIDPRLPPVNGDRYGRGARAFAGVTAPMTSAFSASVFYTRAFHEEFVVPVAHRFDAIVTYNVLATVEQWRRAHGSGGPAVR